MAERQAHGFSYQTTIIKRYNLSEINPKTGEKLEYTDKWDAFFHNIPVSIKTKQFGGNIEMADIFRQANVDSDFILQVGFWKNNEDNIVEEHTLYIIKDEWNALFDQNCLNQYKELIYNISNDHIDDQKWTNEINRLRAIWKKMTPYLIVPRPKRDHKKQKRIQCAINNSSFYKYFIPKYSVVNYFERSN